MARSPSGDPARGPRVGLAMPGGFEFGGIGRVMLYATRAWRGLPGAPACRVIDPRGAGPAPLMPLRLAGAILALVAGQLRRDRLDVLHLNVAGRSSTWRKIALGEVARRADLPYVVHLHDYDYGADLARRGRLGRALTRRLFRGAARVLVLGEGQRRLVTEALRVPPRRVEVVPNGVPDPGAPPSGAGRDGPVRLLFLGHLDDRKGVPELLAALAEPGLRARRWRLVLAGGGQRSRFAALARGLGLEDRVELTGWLPHERVYALCREADVLVLPSHAEGQAMALLEAMAHGLAVVATPVGAHPETVRAGEEALLVPSGDPGRLAEALTRVIDDADLRCRLGAAARDRYLACFTADRLATRLLATYRRVAAERADTARRPTGAGPLGSRARHRGAPS